MRKKIKYTIIEDYTEPKDLEAHKKADKQRLLALLDEAGYQMFGFHREKAKPDDQVRIHLGQTFADCEIRVGKLRINNVERLHIDATSDDHLQPTKVWLHMIATDEHDVEVGLGQVKAICSMCGHSHSCKEELDKQQAADEAAAMESEDDAI